MYMSIAMCICTTWNHTVQPGNNLIPIFCNVHVGYWGSGYWARGICFTCRDRYRDQIVTRWWWYVSAFQHSLFMLYMYIHVHVHIPTCMSTNISACVLHFFCSPAGEFHDMNGSTYIYMYMYLSPISGANLARVSEKVLTRSFVLILGSACCTKSWDRSWKCTIVVTHTWALEWTRLVEYTY